MKYFAVALVSLYDIILIIFILFTSKWQEKSIDFIPCVDNSTNTSAMYNIIKSFLKCYCVISNLLIFILHTYKNETRLLYNRHFTTFFIIYRMSR